MIPVDIPEHIHTLLSPTVLWCKVTNPLPTQTPQTTPSCRMFSLSKQIVQRLLHQVRQKGQVTASTDPALSQNTFESICQPHSPLQQQQMRSSPSGPRALFPALAPGSLAVRYLGWLQHHDRAPWPECSLPLQRLVLAGLGRLASVRSTGNRCLLPD